MTSISEELGYIIAALKRKIMIFLVIVLSGLFISFYFFVDPLLLSIERDLLPEGAELIAISPVEVLLLKLKIALIIGLILAFPVVCHYVYKTLKVRLEITNPMKNVDIILLLGSAISLFILGLCYSYFLMLPLVLRYLYIISTAAGVAATYAISEFVYFVVIISLVLGMSFELPVVIVFVVRSGLVQIETLKSYRRYMYVGMFVIAAIFTPPDVVSQLIVAFPLIAFYEIGILVASLITKRQTHRVLG
jgi:sec-independent protein translocase protein TatC